MKRILVLCTGNSCRSQMAEGWLRHFAKDKAEVYSAGIETHGVNPKAIQFMKEAGIDISKHTSNHINEYKEIDFDYIITVCDHAKENCPYFPANAERFHHNFSDPSKVKGSEEEIANAFRATRDEIRDYSKKFIEGEYKMKVLEKTFPQVGIVKPHLALTVRNVEESINFYKKMFGVEPSKVRIGYAKFDLEFPSLNFTLNEAGKSVSHGALSHLGIQVNSTEDVLKIKEYWEQQGLTARDEMNVSCCYAIQDKTWVKDPDGNEWEVFVVLEDHLPEFKFMGDKANACCSTSSDSGQSCC